MQTVLVPIRRLVLPVAALVFVACGLTTTAGAAPPPGAEGTLNVVASASFSATSIGAASSRADRVEERKRVRGRCERSHLRRGRPGRFRDRRKQLPRLHRAEHELHAYRALQPRRHRPSRSPIAGRHRRHPGRILHRTERRRHGAGTRLRTRGPRLRPGRSALRRAADQPDAAQQRRRPGPAEQPRNLRSRRERILDPRQQLLGDDPRPRLRPARSKSSSTPTKKATSRRRSRSTPTTSPSPRRWPPAPSAPRSKPPPPRSSSPPRRSAPRRRGR